MMWSKNKSENSAIWRWLIFYSLVMLGYAIWSYGLVVPNLWLSSWNGFVRWQEWIWGVFAANREMTTVIWLGLVVLMWVGAAGLIKRVNKVMKKEKEGAKKPNEIKEVRKTAEEKKNKRRENWSWEKTLVMMLIAAGPLLLSYNALSADTFNYIFNAKMVAVYGVDPHVQTAADFPEDEMVRFMHNSHTPAPYGYVWTGLSLPVWLASGGKFLLAWLGTRSMAVASLVLIAGLIWWGWEKKTENLAKERTVNPLWVLLCPLLLIEFTSNNHNDLWMMAATMGSLWLVWEKKRRSWWRIGLSAVVMILGTQIKLASLVAVPFWLYVVWIKDWWEGAGWRKTKTGVVNWLNRAKVWGEKYFFDLLVLGFFVPLLTDRSQQFHPWYWSWCLVWLPFCRAKWVRVGLLAFAASSMLRYVPWLWVGGYGEGILGQQKLVTFLGAGAIWGGILLWEKWEKWRTKRRMSVVK